MTKRVTNPAGSAFSEEEIGTLIRQAAGLDDEGRTHRCSACGKTEPLNLDREQRADLDVLALALNFGYGLPARADPDEADSLEELAARSPDLIKNGDSDELGEHIDALYRQIQQDTPKSKVLDILRGNR